MVGQDYLKVGLPLDRNTVWPRYSRMTPDVANQPGTGAQKRHLHQTLRRL